MLGLIWNLITRRSANSIQQCISRSAPLNAKGLLKVIPSNILDKTYWLCIFAVNEHLAICGDCWSCNRLEAWKRDPRKHLRAATCLICKNPKYNPCNCGMLKSTASDPEHEIDKF